MPSTYTLISSNVLSSSAASVTFSAIPATFTDLVLRVSARSDQATHASDCSLTVNSITTYGDTDLVGNSSTAASYLSLNGTNVIYGGSISAASSTASTFGSLELYIPSYLASANKPISGFTVGENNSSTANQANIVAIAGLVVSTAAITSVRLANAGGNFVSGSSFYLYGIKNS